MYYRDIIGNITTSHVRRERDAVDVELTMLQKKYYRAIYDRNRAYLEYEGSSMAQLVSIVVGRARRE